MTFFCHKCRADKEIAKAEHTVMPRSGRKVMTARCPTCRTKLIKLEDKQSESKHRKQ